MFEILEDETVRLILATIINAPLSWQLYTMKDVKNRRIFSVVLGSLLQIFVFGIIPILKISLFSCSMFLLVKTKPDRCGALVTIISMLYLSFYHFYGLIYRYGENVMDEGVLMMIMVCKYSLFAYAYQDARNPKTHLNEQKQKQMIKQNVSLIQFFQYLQFLPTAIIGPPIDYRKYKLFIMRQSPFDNIPSPKQALFQNFKQYMICTVIFGAFHSLIPTSGMKDPQFFNNSALYVAIYSTLSIIGLRFKYYTAWKLSTFPVHASGVSYLESKNNFRGINHCNVLIVETTPHIREKANNWNMTVQQWLRKCVYQRSPFKNKMQSSLYVFIVSAFWHGYYVGYYLTFFLWFVQIYLQTKIYKYCHNGSQQLKRFYKNPPKAVYLLGLIVANFLFSHHGSFFYLLDSQLCFIMMKKLWFLPQISLFLGILIISVLPSKKRKQEQIKKQN